MLIGALSTETGIAASTIRYYEKLGILPQPTRVSGQRRYGHEAKEYLLVLKLHRRASIWTR